MTTQNNQGGEASRDRLEKILQISQRINSERDLGNLLDVIAHETTALLKADRATIFLLDRERNEIWSKVVVLMDRCRPPPRGEVDAKETEEEAAGVHGSRAGRGI